jgi:hypothetical protein
MTPDRIFYPLAALVAAGLIALAVVYPQGQGDRSPGLFGHPPELQAEAAIALLRHNAKVEADARKAAESLKAQGQAADASQVRTAPLK